MLPPFLTSRPNPPAHEPLLDALYSRLDRRVNPMDRF